MLREDAVLEECYFKNDDDDHTFHLGAFVSGSIASIASFYFENHSLIDQTVQYRLRGMATLPDFQNKGFSSELLKMAFPIIQQNMCTTLWCNARMNAIGFYEKVGFVQSGELFNIEKIGKHGLMILKLKKS